ncbi:mobC protein [Escherichia coli]
MGAAVTGKGQKPERYRVCLEFTLQFLKAEVTRQADVTRILPLINELEALPEQ